MKIISTVTLLCLTAFCLSASMFNEDKLPKKYWETLTDREKHVFLMGYRAGTGPFSEKVKRMPEVPPGVLVLSEQHFDQVIKLVDAFFKDAENQNVRVAGAIEIALMTMQKKSAKDIAQKVKDERNLIFVGF